MNRNDELRETLRLMTLLCWRMLAVFGLALLLAALFGLGYDGCAGRGGTESDTLSVRVDTVHDTTVIEIHDTLPEVRRDTVVRRIPLLEMLTERTGGDSLLPTPAAADSLDIVQREYSDDSTYTAWVSGIRHQDYPRLDSIAVRRQRIVDLVRETVTLRQRQSRWSVGLQAGYGYGLRYRGFEPYVGVGITYRLFPP